MVQRRIELPTLQGYHCFACGTANPIGLNLKFYRLGDIVCTDVTLKKVHEGWENVAHGGIVSTLLDETMSWAIMYYKRVFVVTRNMNIKYVKPVFIGTPLIITGKLVDNAEPPKIKARAEVRDTDGNLLVRSDGEFVEIPRERFDLVTQSLKEDMLGLFETFSKGVQV
jgi:uncharacterized protein (TIGR00369 family)